MNICRTPLISFLLVMATTRAALAQPQLPTIAFHAKSARLTVRAKNSLDSVARMMNEKPTFKLIVEGVAREDITGRYGNLDWDRVNNVISYLVNKRHIRDDRCIFRYGSPADENILVLRDGASEDTPTTAPAPHFNLRSTSPRNCRTSLLSACGSPYRTE